jgi:PPOX class probable F420-dependent enzyme
MGIPLSDATIRLVDGKNYAVLATVNPDGSPQTSVVWVGRDDDDLLFSTVEGRVKHRNMLRDPRVSVTVIDWSDPENYVELRGRVSMTPRRRPAGRHRALLEVRRAGPGSGPARRGPGGRADGGREGDRPRRVSRGRACLDARMRFSIWPSPAQPWDDILEIAVHCEQTGRDPGEIHVSTQAALYLSTSEEWLAGRRQEAQPGAPVVVGTPGEVAEIVARYAEAGADEFIVPDSTLGSLSRKKDACDLFIEQVAPAFR